jgi:hypothetical protein
MAAAQGREQAVAMPSLVDNVGCTVVGNDGSTVIPEKEKSRPGKRKGEKFGQCLLMQRKKNNCGICNLDFLSHSFKHFYLKLCNIIKRNGDHMLSL